MEKKYLMTSIISFLFEMWMLKILPFLLLEIDAQSNTYTNLRHEKLLSLVAEMAQRQKCHVEVSASNIDQTQLVTKIATRIPITLKKLDLSLRYRSSVCILHVIVMTTEGDVHMIDYNHKGRLFLYCRTP